MVEATEVAAPRDSPSRSGRRYADGGYGVELTGTTAAITGWGQRASAEVP